MGIYTYRQRHRQKVLIIALLKIVKKKKKETI